MSKSLDELYEPITRYCFQQSILLEIVKHSNDNVFISRSNYSKSFIQWSADIWNNSNETMHLAIKSRLKKILKQKAKLQHVSLFETENIHFIRKTKRLLLKIKTTFIKQKMSVRLYIFAEKLNLFDTFYTVTIYFTTYNSFRCCIQSKHDYDTIIFSFRNFDHDTNCNF